jgi:hypothetical protein
MRVCLSVCALVAQEAVAALRQRIDEFNACVPYTGLAASSRLAEDALLPALFALLPAARPTGISVAPPAPASAAALIAVLHCLQRLASASSVAYAIDHSPGARPPRASVCLFVSLSEDRREEACFPTFLQLGHQSGTRVWSRTPVCSSRSPCGLCGTLRIQQISQAAPRHGTMP